MTQNEEIQSTQETTSAELLSYADSDLGKQILSSIEHHLTNDGADVVNCTYVVDRQAGGERDRQMLLHLLRKVLEVAADKMPEQMPEASEISEDLKQKLRPQKTQMIEQAVEFVTQILDGQHPFCQHLTQNTGDMPRYFAAAELGLVIAFDGDRWVVAYVFTGTLCDTEQPLGAERYAVIERSAS